MNLPIDLNSLSVSYNTFCDNQALVDLGKVLKSEKNLRVLNISYCLNLDFIDYKALMMFCTGVRENRSLNELVMEGCKVADDPDEFCKLMGEAIEGRKFPIGFKISAVRNNDRSTANYLSKTQDRILKDLTE